MTPFQTLAAQGFTTICMNLQMCRSSGFVVAKFAFLLEPRVNVSKLFQWRRDTPSSSLNLQIDTETISLCKGWGKQSTVYSGDKAPLLLLLLPQDRMKRANCFMDPREVYCLLWVTDWLFSCCKKCLSFLTASRSTGDAGGYWNNNNKSAGAKGRNNCSQPSGCNGTLYNEQTV